MPPVELRVWLRKEVKKVSFVKLPRTKLILISPIRHRICPGRHFGLDSLFIHLASMLHVFDILPPPDARESLKRTSECSEDPSGIVK